MGPSETATALLAIIGEAMRAQAELNVDWRYCEEMLAKVSRTFALNIGKLQGETYRAVLVGYLLFRIADTFEDTVHQTEEEKIKDLLEFAEVFKGNKSLEERVKAYEPLRFKWQENSPEKNLVENGKRVLRCYFDLFPIYREIMDPHIAESAEGMAFFQKRKMEEGQKIFQLRDIPDLENYCYYVAGTVGVMLTQIFSLQAGVKERMEELKRRQVHFGLALQLTNIVKDYTKDLERGWCYIPASVTEKHGLRPHELLALSPPGKKAILGELIPRTVEHLDMSLEYIEILPQSERDIRLFCIIPFILAYHTLLQIAQGEAKLSRPQVYALLGKSEIFAHSNEKLRENYQDVRRKLWELLR